MEDEIIEMVHADPNEVERIFEEVGTLLVQMKVNEVDVLSFLLNSLVVQSRSNGIKKAHLLSKISNAWELHDMQD